jgi:hypothetical protein
MRIPQADDGAFRFFDSYNALGNGPAGFFLAVQQRQGFVVLEALEAERDGIFAEHKWRLKVNLSRSAPQRDPWPLNCEFGQTRAAGVAGSIPPHHVLDTGSQDVAPRRLDDSSLIGTQSAPRIERRA